MIYSQDKKDILNTVQLLNETYINLRNNLTDQIIKENEKVNKETHLKKIGLINDDAAKFMQFESKINFEKFE